MIDPELTGGPYFEAFCARYIRQTKGRWAGKPLIFEDWQREFWWEALELDPVTGLRIYSEVLLGLPRKNGKSTMASAMGLYLLTSDGEAQPEVYVAAAARAQAGIVMGQSIAMVKQSPRLLDYAKAFKYHVECPRNNGIMRAVAADAPLQHGLNPSGNIVDELHAHKDSQLYTALTTGTGAREQPLTLTITTAGVAGEGILGQMYQSMTDGPGEMEVRDSLRIYRDRQSGILIYWYGAPHNADPDDLEVAKGCNPASWLQDGKELTREHRRMKQRGQMLDYRRYHLNQMVEVEEAWLEVGMWEACRNDLPLNPNLPIGVGVDKGQTGDRAAVVVAQRQGNAVVVRAKHFPPESATGRVSSEAIRRYLRELRTTYPQPMVKDTKTKRAVPGPAVAYDPWAFSESSEMLEQEGVNMVRFEQWAANLGPASTMTYELISTGRLCHDGDEFLASHVRNTTAVLTDRGMKVAKPKKPDARPNDAAVAMVMAVAMANQEAPVPFVRKPMKVVGF